MSRSSSRSSTRLALPAPFLHASYRRTVHGSWILRPCQHSSSSSGSGPPPAPWSHRTPAHRRLFRSKAAPRPRFPRTRVPGNEGRVCASQRAAVAVLKLARPRQRGLVDWVARIRTRMLTTHS
jgi:hypothetical protein